jgi:tetratricopeptide (TPR) repeat protein
VFFLATHDKPACQTLIGQWNPQQPIDIFLSGTCRLELILNKNGSQAAMAKDDWFRVLRLYRQLVSKLPQSSSLRVGLAGCLFNLAIMGVSTDRHRDLDEALEQAVIARDIARETSSNSVQAVEIACQAAYHNWQFQRTIQLGTTVTGEATVAEENSDIVRASVAHSALMGRQHDIADRLILKIEDEYRKSILVAISAEVDGHPLANLWESSLWLARDSHERYLALLGLARMGLIDPIQVETLNRELPKEAALISAVAEAATGNPESAIQRLRLIPNVDFDTVTSLAEAYVQAGDAPAAVDALREGARILNEPRLRIDAARLLDGSGGREAAVAELEQLIVDSIGNRTVQRESLGLLAEWNAQQGDWATAQLRFGEVVTLDPNDSKARWAQILSLLQRGLIREARRIYDEAPADPEIALPAHARAWMATRTPEDRADAPRFVNEVIDIAQNFPDDEDVQAQAILTVLSPDSRDSDPLPAATQGRFDRLFHHFGETWPQSSHLRIFTTVDVQALVGQMDELIKPTQQQQSLRADIADQLARNALPWGALSAVTGRTYSEIVLTRAAGVLPAQSGDAQEAQACLLAARTALNSSVVLDISAAGTLVEIPALSPLLLSQFKRILISEREHLDAVEAEFRLRSRSTEAWVYDEQAGRGRIASVSADVANERHLKATVLLSLIEGFTITPVSENERMKMVGRLAESTFVTAVEGAAQANVSLWCDDIALRSIARSIGVNTFSTPSLIDALAEDKILTPSQAEEATRTFIEKYVGDFPLDPVRLSVLATKHAGAADPVGAVFSRAAAWQEFTSAYETWCTLVQQSVSSNPKNASDWLYLAIIGACRPQKEDRQCKEVAAIILSGAVSYIANDPTEVSRCVAAGRAALKSLGRNLPDVDPLGRAVALLRVSLARLTDITSATNYASRAFSDLEADDRQVVLQALYY